MSITFNKEMIDALEKDLKKIEDLTFKIYSPTGDRKSDVAVSDILKKYYLDNVKHISDEMNTLLLVKGVTTTTAIHVTLISFILSLVDFCKITNSPSDTLNIIIDTIVKEL